MTGSDLEWAGRCALQQQLSLSSGWEESDQQGGRQPLLQKAGVGRKHKCLLEPGERGLATCVFTRALLIKTNKKRSFLGFQDSLGMVVQGLQFCVLTAVHRTGPRNQTAKHCLL